MRAPAEFDLYHSTLMSGSASDSMSASGSESEKLNSQSESEQTLNSQNLNPNELLPNQMPIKRREVLLQHKKKQVDQMQVLL